MVEAELVPTGLETVIKLAERLVKFIINSALAKCLEELKYLEKYRQKEIISTLVAITEKDFIRLDYTQAIKILKVSKEKFVFGKVE